MMIWLFLYLLVGYVLSVISVRLAEGSVLVRDLFNSLSLTPFWPIWVPIIFAAWSKDYLESKGIWNKRIW